MTHSLGAWLHAIAHNSALSLLRRRPTRAEYPEDVGAGHEGLDAPREQLDALVSAFLTLAARQITPSAGRRVWITRHTIGGTAAVAFNQRRLYCGRRATSR
jgi:hypothetical protein